MKNPKCPHCKSPPQEGSGGWAVDFTCGTRYGNMSKEVLWRGRRCLEAEKGRPLTKKEAAEHRAAVLEAMTL
jgi:hypothetical protein